MEATVDVLTGERRDQIQHPTPNRTSEWFAMLGAPPRFLQDAAPDQLE